MKKILFGMMGLVGLVMALAISQDSARADCLATVAQVKPAQEVKTQADRLRDAGDYVGAAAKYFQAAVMHPQEAYGATYIMNGVGCLLGTYETKKGKLQYWWDAERGAQNAQAAYAQLDACQSKLDRAKSENCKYSSGVIWKTQAWHDVQLKWLESQVPRVVTK